MARQRLSNNSLPDEDLLAFCQSLVRIPGFSGGEQAIAEVVSGKLNSLGFNHIHQDTYGNVLALWQGDEPGLTLVFDAHMDTVPVDDAHAWQHQPFGGEISRGRLWGRGAADTRCGLAAMVWAVAHLPRRTLNGQILLVASVCEENMTGAALGSVLDSRPVDLLVTAEPTGLKLGVAQKGRATLILESHGRSAHSSVPQTGENAVYKLIQAIHLLKDMEMPADPDLGPAILELTDIISEPYPNQLFIPHGCRASLVGRTLPAETQQTFLQKVRSALQALPGVDASIAELRQTCYTGQTLLAQDFLPGWRNPQDNPFEGKILSALTAAGLPAVRYYVPCGTNASAGAGLRGIPSFIYGPGNLNQAHQADEWVAVDEIISARLGFQSIISAVLGVH